MLNNLIKDCPKLQPPHEDYQRLEYNLKMNLRLINGHFEDMKIYVVNQSQLASSERFNDRTQLETIEMVTKDNIDYFEQLTKLR
jgi:hypothetical protein